MPGVSEENPLLPGLRPEVEILDGPPDAAGHLTFTVHDPFSRTYDQVGYAEAELLRRMREPRPLSELMEELSRETTLRMDADEIRGFCAETVRRGLAGYSPVRDPMELAARASGAELPWWKKALKGYLYFRIPLFDPDRFLTATLPSVERLASWRFLSVLALIFAAGAVLTLERAPAYLESMRMAMNLKGLLAFGVCLVAVKALHEMAHAYTAKAQGLRVPAMGIVFIVLCPVAYTDVTDAWRLDNRRGRLAISAAGVLAEIGVAGIFLLTWALLEPSPLRQVAFFFSFSSLAASLLVNLSPFMRFDGYYLLMDLARIDNMQPRAFALAAWAYRRRLLGQLQPCPEPALGATGRFFLALYGLACIVYRLTLYLGIATLVYHMFFKLLGLTLYGVEITWFVLMPIWREAGYLRSTRGLKITGAGMALLLLLAGTGAYLALPLPRWIELPAVAVPSRSQTLYTPRAGRLAGLHLGRGSAVRQGQPLFTVESPDLDSEIQVLEKQIVLLEKTRELHAYEVRDKSMLSEAEGEINEAKARLAGLVKQREQATVMSEMDGEIVAPDEGLREGLFVAPRQVLGAVADFSRFSALALVDAASLPGIDAGSRAEFLSRASQESAPGKVTAVSAVRIRSLEEAPWATVLRQDLPTVPDAQGRPALTGSYYLVRVDLDGVHADLKLGQKGNLRIRTEPLSRVGEAWRALVRVMARESGF